MNGFLHSHTIVSVDRRWVEDGTQSFWAFCVEYLATTQAKAPTGASAGVAAGAAAAGREKIDYRAKLTPEDFAVFSKLRDLRRDLATAEQVATYMVFTNEQLAAMVENRARSKDDLLKIRGIGPAKIEKYADRFLALLVQPGGKGDEASRATV